MEIKLKSGEAVVDRHRSHLHEGVARLLPDALARIDSLGRKFLVEEVDFGRLVGGTVCVPTGPGDQIVFASRPKRFGLTRFVLNRMSEPSNAVTVILKKDDNEDYYILVTAFVGRRPEPEPWDKKNFSRQPDPQEAERRSREFWASHALVFSEVVACADCGRETDAIGTVVLGDFAVCKRCERFFSPGPSTRLVRFEGWGGLRWPLTRLESK